MAKKATYGNESIKSLRGADRVRKRPAVIFGSDGLEGCEHSIFEIMSNSIDEAREGRGNRIVVTRYLDGSYEVQDLAAVFLWITTRTSSERTGSCCFARCTPGPNMITPAAQAVMSFPGPQRPGALRHPVCVGIYGRGNSPGRLLLHPAF